VPEHPSIRDLAKLAGVSRTTVSLALRDSHEISAPVRERIQKLAREQNYQSHPMVAALMQQVSARRRIHDREAVAAITCDDKPDAWMNSPWVVQAFKGARDESTLLGFRFEIFWAGNQGEDAGELAKILYHRGIRGLLFAPMSHNHQQLNIPWNNFMPVSCTLSIGSWAIPCVTPHQKRGMQILLEELYRRGVRTVGLVFHKDEDQRLEYNWSAGTWSFQQDHKDFITHILQLPSMADGRRFHSWFARTKPEVIITTSSRIPIPKWLTEIGQKAGTTVGYALLDLAPDEEGVIAGLRQNSYAIGQEAIRLISRAIYNNTPGLPNPAKTVLIDPLFVDGPSLAHRPA